MSDTRAKVLIIDDDPVVRRFTALALEALASVRVVEAADGAEGLERALADRPDVILLDTDMPGLSGPETLVRLRANPWTAYVPVMLFVNRASRHPRPFGAEAWVPKSLGPVSLTQEVLELLGRSRTVRLHRRA